ncbi:MAG: hypothetical protein A2Z39_03100 [Deltaproteobacteria bacterium RBG_19FT_COMBO_46_9]|nr:MAG: hypothetical protein A2Z39_03100 [Deltaproteobacteria bacterium RBG_19FT_COMBO_46_9]
MINRGFDGVTVKCSYWRHDFNRKAEDRDNLIKLIHSTHLILYLILHLEPCALGLIIYLISSIKPNRSAQIQPLFLNKYLTFPSFLPNMAG